MKKFRLFMRFGLLSKEGIAQGFPQAFVMNLAFFMT